MATLDLRSVSDAADVAPAESAPLVGRELPLNVTYTSPKGKTYSDAVVSRILDGEGRQKRARAAAILAGVPWAHMPPTEAMRCWALATLSTQLVDPPEWLNEWAPQHDALLFRLANECYDHDTQFFRGGRGTGDDGEEIACVVVSSAGFTASPK